MTAELVLPVAVAELPAAVQRFGDPKAPLPAKMMAAKGLIPVRGADLVALLVQLSADAETSVAGAAKETLLGVPNDSLVAACKAPIHPAIADRLADVFRDREDAILALMFNPTVLASTVARVARTGSESLTEIIATNQQRLLAAPEIIEALYLNKNTRMSTADRLVELAARNGVELHNVASFQAHVEAITGQLMPEPSDEPLPGDTLFSEVVALDSEVAQTVAITEETEEEVLNDSLKPLSFRISKMTLPEKLRLAMVGNATARALLVRDKNRQVAMAALKSPQMTDVEAVAIARSKDVSEDILRFIGNKRDWVKSYEVKRALMFNSKTPLGIAMKFLSHMRVAELKELSRSKSVSASVKSAAIQRASKKTTD